MLRQNKAVKWIFGAVVKLVIIMSLLLRTQRQRKVNDAATTTNISAENKLLNKLYALPLPTTSLELSEVNDELAGLDPEFILKWAHHHLHDSPELGDSHPLVQATSFGPTGLVILDHLSVHNLLDTIPVITMDTLHLFQESYTFYDTVQSHYKKSPLHLTVTKPLDMIEEPLMSKAEFDDAYSSTLWKTDPKLYTKVTKLEPMQHTLDEWDADMWITGRRRSQGGERGKLDVLEFEPYPQDSDMGSAAKSSSFHSSKGRWKLNPLAYWSYDQVWSYIRNNNVPYNPLYDQGYTSIGDEMTTSKPDKSNEDVEPAQLERSGRFAGFGASNKECGLHVEFDLEPADMKLADDKEEEEPEDADNITCDIDMARQGECADE
jgi:phosphoadenosine phosphosulfate reductase